MGIWNSYDYGEEEVVIRLKGTLYKDGKKDKEVIVEESSSEISMSALIIDEGVDLIRHH